MILKLENVTNNDILLQDFGRRTIPANSLVDYSEIPIQDFAASDELLTQIGIGNIVVHNAEGALDTADGMRYVTVHNVPYGPKDVSERPRTHQSSTPYDTSLCWTGQGDNVSVVSNVYDGQKMVFKHEIGDPISADLEIKWNILPNRTFIHEGYFQWYGCWADSVTFKVFGDTTATIPGTNTNYAIYNHPKFGEIIVPTAGNGNIALAADITIPGNGMIYMPDYYDGSPPDGMWDADYNETTNRFENIRPADTMYQGRYHLFKTEPIFVNIANLIPLLNNGFMCLNSSDTKEIGHGMHFRFTMETETSLVADHEWWLCFFMCMHRKWTV